MRCLKKYAKSFVMIVLLLSFVLSSTTPIQASQPLNLVVIGDSIAKGVGSSDAKTKCYSAIISDKIGGNLNNLGITGLDSGQLIDKLDTDKFKKPIKSADVVLISIGSNDLLKPFLNIVSDSIGADSNVDKNQVYEAIQDRLTKLSDKSLLKAASALSSVVHELTDNKTLNKACEKFPSNFTTILKKIKELNPNAVIIVDNVYNPYYGVAYDLKGVSILNVYQLCEGYIQKLNKAFDNNSSDYKMMDMYTVFQQEGYTNVNKGSLNDMSKVNYDPHPNDDGYRMMADYIYTQMDSQPPTAQLDDAKQVMEMSQESLTIHFSEAVRSVSGKRVFIRDKKKEYAFVLDDAEMVPEDDGTYSYTIPLSEWLDGDPEKKLEYDTDFDVVAEEGAFKDKGNNSLENESIGTFHTEKKPAEVEAMGNAKKAKSDSKPIVVYIIAAVVVFGLIVVAFLTIKNIRKKRI